MTSFHRAVEAIYKKYGYEGLCLLRALVEATKRFGRAKFSVINDLVEEWELCRDISRKKYLAPLLPGIRDLLNNIVGEEVVSYLTTGWSVCNEGRNSECLEELEQAINMFTTRKTSREEIEDTEDIPHEKVVEMLVEIGKELGFDARKEYTADGIYRYDVVWFKPPAIIPLKVFEVVTSGSDVDRALSRLKHAFDVWRGTDLYIVITNKAKRQRVEALIGNLLRGAFHEIANKLVVLDVKEVKKLRESITTLKKLKITL